ncbi:hypothetical protein [Treponema socranskii]|uniref:hypothetical protein n=1 Tax=Treponema socranskii TaxID=53419 RepID=UPI003D6EB45F
MKKILYAAFAAFMLVPLSALDWGGKFNTTTKYQGKKAGSLFWNQSLGAHAWLTTPINEQLRFGTDASYEFRYDQDGDVVKNIIDINLLKLTGTFHAGKTGMFEFGAGRFSLSDATGIIFSQMNDGVYAKYSIPRVSASTYLGITRLLNSHDVVILRHFSDTTVKTEDASAVYVLGPSYIPLGFSINIPSLFLNQDITIEEWNFIDFSGDDYHRHYGTLMFSGPILSNLFYSASSTLGTENMRTISNLIKLSLSFYPVKEASVGFSGIYASGNNGGFDSFRGFSSQTAVLASETAGFGTEYDGKIKTMLTGSYTFLSNICVAPSLALVFACPEKISYNGFQWRLDAMWNIFHDLQLSSSIYQYIGKDKENDKICFSLGGTFVF